MWRERFNCIFRRVGILHFLHCSVHSLTPVHGKTFFPQTRLFSIDTLYFVERLLFSALFSIPSNSFIIFTSKDINECLTNNGHGPCEGNCINFGGGYKCNCDDIIGHKLSKDNHTCEDIDECSLDNAGCSHTCLNTPGSVFCLCPDGFYLTSDGKTCQGESTNFMNASRCRHEFSSQCGIDSARMTIKSSCKKNHSEFSSA